VVDFGDEVVHLLLRDPDRLHVQRSAVDDGPGGACGLDGHVEHGVQVGGRHELFNLVGRMRGTAPHLIEELKPDRRCGRRQYDRFYPPGTWATPETMQTRFILIQTSHAGNVGATARAMKVMGFDDLVLVAPRWANVLRREETIQRASGALDVLDKARIVATLDEALDGMTHLCATAMTPRDFGPPTVAPRPHFEALAAQARAADG
jgi:hypothetical protein